MTKRETDTSPFVGHNCERCGELVAVSRGDGFWIVTPETFAVRAFHVACCYLERETAGVSSEEAETVTNLLADDLARVLADEPLGLSRNELALRVHRRRSAVGRVLEADPRFVRVGEGRASRWNVRDPLGPGSEALRLRERYGTDPLLIPGLMGDF